MKRISFRAYAPHFGPVGTFSLCGAKVLWVAPNDLVEGSWVSLQVALLGFSACLTWWRA